jgi:hypothetical protein
MNERIRQMILGLGTFGTGTALLYLDVNPLLLILTDTVVGVGMLFAAGSISVGDLHIPRRGAPGKGSGTPGAESATGAEGSTAPRGIRASLRKRGGSLKPSVGVLGKGKEEKEAEKEKMDLMLDSALVGQSRRIISLAEGQGGSTAAVDAAMETQAPAQNPFQDLSGSDIPTQLLEEVSPEEELSVPGETSVKPEVQIPGEIPSVSLPQPEEEEGAEPQVDVLKLADGGIGADDLLSSLRLEAMKEKKKDDMSLLRDMKGVKVTGRQLLDELSTVLQEMKGR